jgi:hypothetical protein
MTAIDFGSPKSDFVKRGDCSSESGREFAHQDHEKFTSRPRITFSRIWRLNC